jgi:hypothetical protein
MFSYAASPLISTLERMLYPHLVVEIDQRELNTFYSVYPQFTNNAHIMNYLFSYMAKGSPKRSLISWFSAQIFRGPHTHPRNEHSRSSQFVFGFFVIQYELLATVLNILMLGIKPTSRLERLRQSCQTLNRCLRYLWLLHPVRLEHTRSWHQLCTVGMCRLYQEHKQRLYTGYSVKCHLDNLGTQMKASTHQNTQVSWMGCFQRTLGDLLFETQYP